MLRKNVLLKQTKTTISTSICSNSSIVSNVEDYVTAYEDSDVFYSFSEDIDKNQTENTTPPKNVSNRKSEISRKNTSTPISKKVLGMTLDNISFIDTETEAPVQQTNQDPPVIQITNEFGETTGNKSESNAGEHTTVIMKENESLEGENKEDQKLSQQENQNFDVILINDSSQMEISDVIVINDSIPNKSQDAEPEKETVTAEAEIKPLDAIIEKDETDENCLEVVPESNEEEAKDLEEPEPEPESTEVQNVVEEKVEIPSLEPQSSAANAITDAVATPDIEVRDNFLKKYRETIQTHPFENEEADLAEGIALMSFPEDNPSEARNPFTASKIRKPTRTLNLLPPNRRVTRRSMLPLPPAPVDEPKKIVNPYIANKRKSTVPPSIEEKPVAKRGRPSILPRIAEPRKPVERSTNSNSNKTAIDRFQCKYCDRKFGVEKALHNHQEDYCTKIPDKDKRQLLVNNFKSSEKFVAPPPPAPIRGRKSIVPPSSIITRNQARMSIGQPVYSGITRTPSKTLTCTTCGSKFQEVLDFANHVLVHRDERIAEEN